MLANFVINNINWSGEKREIEVKITNGSKIPFQSINEKSTFSIVENKGQVIAE